MSDAIIIIQPETFSEQERLACISVLREGNAVDVQSAKRELPHAIVAVKRDGQHIAAVGAIKRPRPDYASSIITNSDCVFNKSMHELGYVAVTASHRGQGLSYAISAKLLSEFKDRPIFATTSSDHMKRTLSKLGFVQQGNEWEGKRKDILSLWISASD